MSQMIVYWTVGVVLLGLLAFALFGVASFLYAPYSFLFGRHPPPTGSTEETLTVWGVVIWVLIVVFGIPTILGWLALVMT